MADENNNHPSDNGDMSRRIDTMAGTLIKLNLTAKVGDLVVATVQQVLAEAGPRQAEVLRRCAIPHWFDADVLRVLRERDEGNQAILEQLAEYSFVRPLDDGRFAYHEEVRQMLLKEWRDSRPDDLRMLNARLADYFQERALASAPNRSLPKNIPFMTLSAAPTGDWEICARESIYHRLQADQEVGLRALRAEFDNVESAHRLADAEALLQMTRDVPLDPHGKQVITYLRARAERAALRLEQAEQLLDQLYGPGLSDQRLLAEVGMTLGEVLAETGKWVRAITLYERSLAFFQSADMRYEAATTMLRIGEAYQEIGLNTGGWHVAALPQNPVWNTLGRLWWWVLALPFALLLRLSSRMRDALPLPGILASYQNWLLVWTYRTAQRWYADARAAFEAQGEDAGMLLAEQRTAQIRLIFGYPQQSLELLDSLLRRPAAEDRYTRAWIQRDRANALLELDDLPGAQMLLDDAQAAFREVGDVRREAGVLAVASRLDVQMGRIDEALHEYRDCLARYRELHFSAAREQALYDLRAWRRRIGPGAEADRITTLLADEPEKRYVSRFPRSQRPMLQALSLSAVPLLLLLMALAQLISPSVRLELIGPLAIQLVYYDPVRALAVLLVLPLLYSAVYTLMGLVVIFLVPLDRLGREQPDYLITTPEAITRYGERGQRVQRLEWPAVRRWVGLDRRLWVLPLPLFSSTRLAQSADEDVGIDGITSWYLDLNEDIGQRLRTAGNPVPFEELGFSILRSKSGVSFVAGLVLLLVFMISANGWVAGGVLLRYLPIQIYAVAAFLVFSGVLVLVPFAYWLATRPLAQYRALGDRNGWPYVLLVIGAGAIALGLGSWFGVLHQLPTLDVGLFFWGIYVCADALVSIGGVRRLAARTTVIGLVLLLAVALTFPRIETSFQSVLSNVATARTVALLDDSASADNLPAQSSAQVVLDSSEQVIAQSGEASGEQLARAYIERGAASYYAGDYEQAALAYTQALDLYNRMPGVTQQTLVLLRYNRALALRGAGVAGWEGDFQLACESQRMFDLVLPECQEGVRK
ncbi:MAG TPA: hypothetical protein VFS21_06765 [Roseiflexaceae bacterium]|nr:hypothetical protein [Roseiflexaceae bacterium]